MLKWPFEKLAVMFCPDRLGCLNVYFGHLKNPKNIFKAKGILTLGRSKVELDVWKCLLDIWKDRSKILEASKNVYKFWSFEMFLGRLKDHLDVRNPNSQIMQFLQIKSNNLGVFVQWLLGSFCHQNWSMWTWPNVYLPFDSKWASIVIILQLIS